MNENATVIAMGSPKLVSLEVKYLETNNSNTPQQDQKLQLAGGRI